MMTRSSGQPGSVVFIVFGALCLALTLSACGGDESDDPTATQEVVAVAETPTAEPPSDTPTPSPVPPTPTPSPEPEPSATPTRSGPAPTVAMPILRTPTPIPVPTDTPEPVPDIPQETVATDGSLGELLLSTDLSDWAGIELDFGSGFFSEGTYHIQNSSESGQGIILRSEQNDFGDVLLSVDVRLVAGEGTAFGCAIARGDYNFQYNYTLCLSTSGETWAGYEWIDPEGAYQSETFFETTARPGTNPMTEWNQLTIISQGEDLGFFINDEYIGYVTHAGPVSGSVGFYVSNYGPGAVEFEFANLNVWAVN